MIQAMIVGLANMGKSTLFNALSGGSASVGNYAGVTVGVHRGQSHAAHQPTQRAPNLENIAWSDAPGVASLAAKSPGEVAALRALFCLHHAKQAPDVLVLTLCASALERGLLGLHLWAELGLPGVLALTASDTLMPCDKARLKALEQQLNIPVVHICAPKGEGLAELEAAVRTQHQKALAHEHLPWLGAGAKPSNAAFSAQKSSQNSLQNSSRDISQSLAQGLGQDPRFVAAMDDLATKLAPHLEVAPTGVLRGEALLQTPGGLSFLLTASRWAIEAVFAGWSQSAAALDVVDAARAAQVDWMYEALYTADGAILSANLGANRGDRDDRDARDGMGFKTDEQGPGDTVLAAFGRALLGDRYRWADALWRRLEPDAQAPSAAQNKAGRAEDGAKGWSARLDRIALHRRLGLWVFALVMLALFQFAFTLAQPLVDLVDAAMGLGYAFWAETLPPGAMRSFWLDGVWLGLSNVLVFVPQIALLFAAITFLEESGYMVRAAVVVDHAMRAVGLPGGAFVPLMSSFACAVPGIMATRMLPHRRDRLATMLVAPLLSCSARLPVYTLVIAAAFAQMTPWLGFISVGGFVMACMYLLGLGAALGVAWLLKRTVLPPQRLGLVVELPAYAWPKPSRVWASMVQRVWAFVRSSGPVIVGFSMLLWFLLSFPQGLDGEMASDAAGIAPTISWEQKQAQQLEHSYAGQLGHAIEPWIAPLGFDWRIGIGLVASFAAREVLVSTLGQVYALGDTVDELAPSLHHALRAGGGLTPLVGISLMVFFVIALQCMSTVAVMRKETGGWGWPIAQLLVFNSMAYGCSLGVYQLGRALGFA